MKKYKVILTESEMRKLNEMNIDTNSSGFRFKDKNGKPGYAAQVLMFLNDRPDGSATKEEMVFAGIDIYGMSAGVLTKLRKAGLITLNGSVWTITDEGIKVAESLGSWTDNRSERQNAIFEAKKYRNRCIKLIKDYFEDYDIIKNIDFFDLNNAQPDESIDGQIFFNSIKTRNQFDCDSERADLADYLTNKLGTEVYVDMNPYQKTVHFGVSFVEDPD